MKTFVTTLIIAILSISAAQCQTLSALKKKTTGYWEIPFNTRAIRKGDEILSPGNDLFYYDGNHVIIMLYTLKAWMWKSDDDFYKLKSKWGNDSLYYLPPFGRWTYLARFDGNNFFYEEQNEKWTYINIEKDKISKNDSAILKERKLHDYMIKPTDRR